MSQTRLESFIETCTQTFIGFWLGMITQIITFHQYGIEVTWSTSFQVAFWFTLVSVVKGYIIRRWFNAGIKATIRKLIHGRR